jgi:hypothetical protein
MKSTLKYGAVTGTIVGIFAIAFFAIVNGLNTSNGWGMAPANIRGFTGLLTILILATGIYTTMQAVKKQQANHLTYGQALKAGVIVAIITAVLTALFGFIYCQFINPGYAQYMLAEAQKVMVATGETKQQIAEDSKSVISEYSTGMQVAQALIGQTVVGTVVSLIMGLFIKSKK